MRIYTGADIQRYVGIEFCCTCAVGFSNAARRGAFVPAASAAGHRPAAASGRRQAMRCLCICNALFLRRLCRLLVKHDNAIERISRSLVRRVLQERALGLFRGISAYDAYIFVVTFMMLFH